MKTSELQGKALDYAVALIEGELQRSHNPALLFEQERAGGCDGIGIEHAPRLHYSTAWDEAGPIIERERIRLNVYTPTPDLWVASIWRDSVRYEQAGPTPLVAAMRCYVASRLGDNVYLPEGIT